jgi:hypothetical protein
MKSTFLPLLFLLISCSSTAFGQTKSIDSFVSGFEKQSGFFNQYFDIASDKVYIEVSDTETEFLYYTSLARGLGSNDIGLDRGRLGSEHVLKFEKHGNKLLLIEANYSYRAVSDDPLEQKAVEESFAKSVHFGFEIKASSASKYLIELTPFIMRDAIDAAQTIARSNEGNYSFDASKSALYREMTKSFPENTEFETIITLTGTKPGRNLQQVVPTASAVTMHQHHSFVKLPDASGYNMRPYDPRIGYLGISYYDYASSISEPIEKRFTSRHRLKKKDPTAVQSEAVEPIIYYMDRGAPEPIRSALMEGAAWWNQAFEAAGYKDAFQVKLLPEDADPMDIRYNLIQWVHRSTRGWSYGASITDPRTGEILKGKITLGSLRVRQDFMIAQGLVGNFETDTSNVAEITQMALSRLRQLAAHEVGHTLGLPHNYISSISGRASVMDYPHPLVAEKSGEITLDAAYAEGMGGYDISAIQWGYQDFPENANEKAELERIVQNMFRKGFQFLTDQDARPMSSVHPQTHLWDNGESASAELKRLSKIRSIVLSNFDERKIRTGEPMATLEEVFVPMYMFHRFQIEAASKVLAGAYYGNVRKGDAQTVFLPVSANEQWDAFDALMETVKPGFLSVPMSVLKNIPPRPYRYSPNQREVFDRTTGMGFDPLAPPRAAATLTLTFLLHPERAARLAVQKAYNTELPDLNEVLNRMTKQLIENRKMYRSDNYLAQIDRTTASIYLNQLMKLSNNPKTSVDVNAIAFGELKGIQNYIRERETKDSDFGLFVLKQISAFTDNPTEFNIPDETDVPDGQPIGGLINYLQGCSN